MTSNEKPTDFETTLKELEALVLKMESGDETLEESIKNFEYGIHLARQCQESLRAAEIRIEKLTKNQDGDQPEKYHPPKQGQDE
jgi:exodeoxyribonuclease VII small subunit